MNRNNKKDHSRTKRKLCFRRRNSSLCDCCTEPMRNIITQLAGQTIVVRTFGSSFGDVVPQQPIVNGYLARFEDGRIISICQVLYLSIDADVAQELVLDPIRMDCGECKCCEDPFTQYLSQNIGNTFVFILINGETTTAEILRVGEGIVILANDEGATLVASTCKLDSIRPV